MNRIKHNRKEFFYQKLVGVYLLLILSGSIFLNSRLFIEYENTPKEYFVLITTIVLMIGCLTSSKLLQLLKQVLLSNFLMSGLSFICLLTSLHGLLQFLEIIPSHHSAFLITGTYENPAGFAAVQASLFPFVFVNCFNDEYYNIQRFSMAIAILCFISVLLSGSRSALLALCAVVIIVLAFNDTVIAFFKTNGWLLIPLFLIVVLTSILLYYLKQDSADGRIFIWKRCFELIKERPFCGYGFWGFHKYYMSAQADFFRLNPDSQYVMLADCVTHPFNEYIKLIVRFGFLGLLIALLLLIWIVRLFFKSQYKNKVVGLSFTTSLFVMCQFSYPFSYISVWLLAVFAIIPALLDSYNGTLLFPRYIRIIVSLFLTIILSITIRKMYFDMKWTEISKRSIVGQTDRMLKYYEGMPSSIKRNPLFLYNYAAELNQSGHHEQSLGLLFQCSEKWNDYDVQLLFSSIYVSLHDKEKAIQSFEMAHFMIPCRFEPLYGEMLVYKEFNDTINALRVADEINEKPIKVRSERVTFIVESANKTISLYER